MAITNRFSNRKSKIKIQIARLTFFYRLYCLYSAPDQLKPFRLPKSKAPTTWLEEIMDIQNLG